MNGRRRTPLVVTLCFLGAAVGWSTTARALPAAVTPPASLGSPTPVGGYIVRVGDGRGVMTVSRDEAAVLAADADVISVEPNTLIRVTTDQGNPPWGLDRIDQRSLPADHRYSYGTTGFGMTAYVLDTGIRTTHAEFTGRIAPGAAVEFDDNGVEDCNGHGTHVSGIIGGTTYGVAKQVTIVPVRVLSCAGTGSLADVIDGLEWAIDDHRAGEPAVLNLSLGGAPSYALDAAVNAAIADGITVVVAAGNDALNTCNFSPGRVPAAITVGASESDDHIANYSDYGTCNDLFAPGDLISSAWITGDTARATLSGTSMAAPHVSGAVARLLEEDPTLSPAQVWAELNDSVTVGTLSGTFGGDPNKLLYASPVPPGPSAPRNLVAQRADAQVALSWLPPSDNHGSPVTDYIVEFRPAGGTWSTFDDGVSTATAATVTGLSNGHCYEFAVSAVNANGVGVATSRVFATPAAHAFVAIAPVRLVDTRAGEAEGAVSVPKTPVGSNATLRVDLVGVTGLPAEGVAAVSMNVTAVDARGAGYVTVFPCGALPLASNLNYTTSVAVANAVTSALSPDGSVCFFSSNVTDLVVDLAGWYPAASGFTSVEPYRLLDSRNAHFPPATGERVVVVAGQGGVPDAGVAAVSLNVTAVAAAAPGFVTVYPCTGRPLASNLNYAAGGVVANAVLAPLSTSGAVCAFSSSPVDLVVDVNGWFPAGSSYTPLAPARLFDTRSAEAQGAIPVVKQRYGELRVDLRGAAGLPDTGVAAVALNVTAVDPIGAGFVTVYPCGTRPLASSINFVAGQIIANAVTTQVSADGAICVFGSTATDLVADVSGWFASG